MIDEADPTGGLARAALAIATVIISHVRNGRLSAEQATSILATARRLVRDPESFEPKPGTADAADNMLRVSELMARLQGLSGIANEN